MSNEKFTFDSPNKNKMSIKTKNISIADLILWDENARFPDKYFNTEEAELIGYFLSKSDFKIKPFVESVVKDFDLPQLEKLVVWNNNGQHVVLEGNRRLTAYKLLSNPELANDTSLKKFLNEQKSKLKIGDNFHLECLVTDDKEDGFRYIDRKHANGNNEVNWQEPERTNYKVRRGSKNQGEILKTEINKVVRQLDLPEEMKEQILGSGKVTTFYRVITSTPAKEKYGLALDEQNKLKIENPAFNEELKVIAHNVIAGKDFNGNDIDSRSLNKTDKIEDYINSIKTTDTKKVDEDIKKNTSEDLFGEKSVQVNFNGKKKVLPKSSDRKHLIPPSCRLTINERKINNIYRELRDDLLLDDTPNAVPNAVGVLFRVFLEISIDCLWEKEGFSFSKETKLAGKITKCCDHLEKKKIAMGKQLHNIRKVATDQHHLLNIQHFHDYVHSYKTQPSPTDLKHKWDNLQEFFEIIWEHHNKKATRKKKK